MLNMHLLVLLYNPVLIDKTNFIEDKMKKDVMMIIEEDKIIDEEIVIEMTYLM